MSTVLIHPYERSHIAKKLEGQCNTASKWRYSIFVSYRNDSNMWQAFPTKTLHKKRI